MQAVDDVIGALGEIGESAFFDFAVMPEGLPEEDGGRGVAGGDAFDIHGDIIGRYCGVNTLLCQVKWGIYVEIQALLHGYYLHPYGED